MFLFFPLLKLFLSLAFISPPYDPVHPVEKLCVGNGNLKCFVLVLSEIGGENPLRKSPIPKALFTFHHFPCTFSLEISMDKIFGTNMKLRMFCPPKNLYPFHGMVLISFWYAFMVQGIFWISAEKILGGQNFRHCAWFSTLLSAEVLSNKVWMFQ